MECITLMKQQDHLLNLKQINLIIHLGFLFVLPLIGTSLFNMTKEVFFNEFEYFGFPSIQDWLSYGITLSLFIVLSSRIFLYIRSQLRTKSINIKEYKD